MNRAIQSREDTIIAGEKEQIAMAWNSLMVEKATGKISNDISNEDFAEKFEEELNKNGDNIEVIWDDENNYYTVTFGKTGHIYSVDSNGNINQEDTNIYVDNNKITHINIYTSSIGSFDATLTINSYSNKKLIESKNIIYTEAIGKYIEMEFIKIHYNSSTYKWEITALENIKYNKEYIDIENMEKYKYTYMASGQTLTNSYYNNIDFTFYRLKDQENIIQLKDDYIENIYTYSIGSYDASLQLDKYEENNLISSENILYTNVSGKNNSFKTNLIEIYYSPLTIVALKNICYREKNKDTIFYLNKGETITFNYTANVDYEFFEYEIKNELEDKEKLEIKDSYMENIYTYSVGGLDASLQLDKYEENNLISSENILYTNVSGKNNSFKTNLIEIYYSPWTIVALKNICYREKNKEIMHYLNKGDTITFNYTSNVDYEFFEITSK